MKLGRIAIIIFWLIMTGWLIRYEAFPELFTEPFSGYHSLLKEGPFIFDSWMQVSFKESPIGYSHTWIDSHMEFQNESYTMNNTTLLNLKLMGLSQWIKVSAGATLDAQYRLQKFFAALHSSGYTTRFDGEKISQDQFNVRVQTAGGDRELRLSIPDDAILYSPMTEMALRRLQPGQSFRLRAFDPLSLTVSDIHVQALRKETLHYAGHDEETTVLKLNYEGLDMLSWINAEGRMLRQETPFGWTLQACSAKDVLTFKPYPSEAEDMLTSLAVPCQGAIAKPRSCQRLTLRLHGSAFDVNELVSHRQTIDAQGTHNLQLTVMAQWVPLHCQPIGSTPLDYRPLLASSAFIQSDHPDIVRQAKAIIGTRTNSFETATAIFDWVYHNVQKRSTVSLPSALDVLQKMEGDCNEHTYLFVALARAAGLPARIHVGLVYASLDGKPSAFYYHAWPSVYIGEWVEMDPTLGQLTVDATHISLMTGELGDQIKLLGLLGKTGVEILAEN